MDNKMDKKSFVKQSTPKKFENLEAVSDKAMYPDLKEKGQSYLVYCGKFKIGGTI